MQILRLADQFNYFPDLTVPGGRLAVAILNATAKAEGPQGANRRLGITEYFESPKISANRIVLSYWPLVKKPDGEPDIEVTYSLGSGFDGFGRSAGGGGAQVLDSALYKVDFERGEIDFPDQEGQSIIHQIQNIRSNRYRDRLSLFGYDGCEPSGSELRVRYKAGFDFDLPEESLSEDARMIKALVAELLNAKVAADASFIKKEVVTDFHSFEYSTDSISLQADSALQALRGYSARSSS